MAKEIGFLQRLWARFTFEEQSPADVLAHLLMAAKEDETLRHRLLILVRAPSLQRQSLVNTLLEEMRMKGEPESIRTAFAFLGTEEGAHTAQKLLQK